MANAKTVLVTGYAGFIGSAVATRYAQSGCEVYGVGNGARHTSKDGVQSLNGILDGEICKELMDKVNIKPDIILHCAGGSSVSASIGDGDADYRRTVNSTQALTDWTLINAPKAKIVYTSSGAVYGNKAGSPNERGATAAPVSPYGKHKWQAETILSNAALHDGLNVSIVRLFSIYGPELKKQIIWDACCKLTNNQADFFGTGMEKRDFVEISDVTELLMLAAQTADNTASVIDGGSGRTTAISELIALIAKHLSAKSSIQFTGNIRAGDPNAMIANTSAANEIGWSPKVSLNAGIKRYCSWFQSEIKNAN